MWHLVSVVVSWILSRGLSGKLGKPLTIRLCSFTLPGVSSLLPHDATSSHWGSRRSHGASLYTFKNSASAEWSCINLRYGRERHQHTGCVHWLWVWLFIVVSCFSGLSISCLWIATHSSQIQLMITFIHTHTHNSYKVHSDMKIQWPDVMLCGIEGTDVIGIQETNTSYEAALSPVYCTLVLVISRFSALTLRNRIDSARVPL